jgi:transcriptional regulator with XRE-family HTH domain
MSENTQEREGRVVARVPEDTYARRLMLTRDHAGHLSIREAADMCGLNYASWANWEKGTRSRTMMDDTRAIAETLGVDLGWLRDGGPLTKPERQPRRRLRLTYARRSIRPGDHGPRRPRRLDRGRAVAA